MKAIVFRGVGDIGLEEVPEPAIEDPHDAVVRLTHAGTVAAVVIYAGYLVPIVFTRRYPAIVRARYANRPSA